MGHFNLKSKKPLGLLQVGDRVDESDFSTVDNGFFYQFEYVPNEERKLPEYVVKPGVFTIHKTMAGLDLVETTLVEDNLLDKFVVTDHIEDKVNCFFRNLWVYEKIGVVTPKRAMLLYGPPGSGKTTQINKVVNKYNKTGKSLVVVWPTSVIEAYDVKEFIKVFKYEGVDNLFLVAEDVGGVEMEQVRVRSDPALLSLLDNKEQAFRIPTFIMATTNHPEMFLENLGNRPDRFDDKIEVGMPPKEARIALLEFFSKGFDSPSEDAKNLLISKACERFSPAHIKDVVVQSALYEKPMVEIINKMIKEMQAYDKGFAKNGGSVGFGG